MINTLIRTIVLFLDMMIGCIVGVTVFIIISTVIFLKNEKGDKNERKNDTNKGN